MQRRDIEKLRRQGAKRAELADVLENRLRDNVQKKERVLFRVLKSKVLDKLEVDESGVIRNTKANFRLLSNVDLAFNEFAKEHGVMLAQEVVNGIGKINNVNKVYFDRLANSPTKLLPTQSMVTEYMSAWLGLSNGGGIIKNGYLDKIIQSDEVRLEVQNLMSRSLIGKKGWKETMIALEKEIVSTQETKGALDKYYRNFVYDTFATSDRVVAETYRNELGLQFAIYEGGIIKTTRPFCRERNGKVFHYTEIEKFNPPNQQPDYNPFINAGGYSCRHYLNWIPDEYAFMLREDAEDLVNNLNSD